MNNLQVFDSPESLCKAAADMISELSTKYIAENGRFTIVLSGGQTPKKLFSLLSQPPYSITLNWEKFYVFWGDERYLPVTDENNNSNQACKNLLDHVPVPQKNIFVVPVDLEPQKAAATYEEYIKGFFGNASPQFDCILLGLGENGHTASLFPHTPILKEKTSLVSSVFVKEMNMYRISFTATLINLAKQIVFLVTGKEKSSILCTIFTSAEDPDTYPAQLIKPVNGDVYWYADKEAASQLKE